MSPGRRRLSVPDAPRTRTSTVAGTSPSSSRPAGNCCSSSGTRRPRSTVSSPETTIHSSSARPSDSSFSPRLPKPATIASTASRVLRPPRFGVLSRRCSTSARSRARSSSLSSPRSIWPSTTIEMLPVSSDTTIATASFSSVRPIAARWREPSSLLNFGFTVSGRKQAAAATRSSCTMTAPSCSGDVGWKMLSSRS